MTPGNLWESFMHSKGLFTMEGFEMRNGVSPVKKFVYNTSCVLKNCIGRLPSFFKDISGWEFVYIPTETTQPTPLHLRRFLNRVYDWMSIIYIVSIEILSLTNAV